MKRENVIFTILALILIPIVCFFVFLVGGFFISEGYYNRDDLTAEQQKKIAYALGYDLAPGETLSIRYYVGFWPKTIAEMLGEIYGMASEEDFLSRCHEKTMFIWFGNCAIFGVTSYDRGGYEASVVKQFQSMINNRWEPWLLNFIIWGGLAAEVMLIRMLLVNRRKSNLTPPPATPRTPSSS